MTSPTKGATKKKEPRRCIICGTHKYVTTHKLPHGQVHLCGYSGCMKRLSMSLDEPQRAVPIMWVSYQDFLDHDLLSKEILDRIKDNDYRMNAANGVSAFLWDGQTMGDLFGEALDEVAKEMEKWYVNELKDEELPTIDMDSLNSEEARSRLEARLKGDE